MREESDRKKGKSEERDKELTSLAVITPLGLGWIRGDGLLTGGEGLVATGGGGALSTTG